jgi:hypothetical protein
LSLVTKASRQSRAGVLTVGQAPEIVGFSAATVGKFADRVSPVMYDCPAPSTAIAVPMSSLLPPRYVEYVRAEPAGSKRVTKASLVDAAPSVAWNGLTVGKLVEAVVPVTWAAPVPSTATPRAPSAALPPRNVE